MENNVFTKQWWAESLQLTETTPINFEDDDNYKYINNQLSVINKAADYFNVPIDDLEYAFTAAQNVVLMDDVWAILENTNSYNIESIGQVILYAQQHNIDIKPYLEAIKNAEPLPPPLILRYEADKYYLVAGELILSLYRALDQNPEVLQATLSLNINEEQEVTPESEPKSEVNLVDKFIQYCMDELKLTEKPQITFSGDTGETKDKCSFGYFVPSTNIIWVYGKDRNMADIFRTLAHELVHRKQDEDGRINYESGDTGSEIENEANAMAGVLLRNFGKQHNNIYDTPITQYITLEEAKPLNELGNRPFKWNIQSKTDDQTIYEFDTPSGNYITVIIKDQNANSNYDLSFEALDDSSDNKQESVAILSTVLNITNDFINNNDFKTVTITPISENRFRVFKYLLETGIDSNKYGLKFGKNTIEIYKK